MNFHETIIRWKVVLEDWWYGPEKSMGREVRNDDAVEPPKEMSHLHVGEPVPVQSTAKRKTREEIIMSHVFKWSSFVVLVLAILVVQVMLMMKGRHRQR